MTISVKYLDASPNRSAGALLGNWYSNDRILYRDKCCLPLGSSPRSEAARFGRQADA
ncbi:hypothetical protein [Streptomyces sp.]|uniref:hypothetical protein n=1 Tax=Streptomyces sp. TaxID=1931 RepID=UPI002D797623|nr:hypothetical protein [Streptomyces sp.]HET6359301.1 hypothetical protein [Streptomyces sp.]